MARPIITESPVADPLAAQVAQVRAFNRFYTNVIGVLHGLYLDSPYTLTEGRVLFEIARRPAVDAVDVSWLRRELDIDAGYLSRVLSRFEADTLVTRHRSESDARRQEIRVTDAGRAAMADLDRRAAQQIGVLLRGTDRGRLLDAMRVITEVLGRPKESVTPEPETPETPETPARVVTLRPFGPGDLGWVLQRHGTRYAAEFGWDASFEALVAGIVADYARGHDPARESAWIAEVNGERAGCVFCVAGDEGIAKLRILLVHPSARGSGIGRRLVSSCMEFARGAGYSRMQLWTNDVLVAARGIYLRHGFALTAQAPHHSFGADLVGQTYEADLAEQAYETDSAGSSSGTSAGSAE
jgi:DNA-binding MarR family transcriptional regulator/GNAT superfamily N-acetyltransferase